MASTSFAKKACGLNHSKGEAKRKMNLSNVISDSLSNDASRRTNAEANLKAFESQPTFLFSLLSLVAETQDLGVKLAAAVYFKNTIQSGWDPIKEKNFEKDQVRAGILQVISQNINTPNVRSQLICSLGIILQADLPLGAWNSYSTDIQRALGSTDVVWIHTGLLGLLEFVKSYQ